MDIDYNVSRNILEEGLRVKFSIITIKWKNTKRCITNMVFIKRETKYCEHSKRMHSKFIFYAFLFALKKEKLKTKDTLEWFYKDISAEELNEDEQQEMECLLSKYKEGDLTLWNYWLKKILIKSTIWDFTIFKTNAFSIFFASFFTS